MSDLSELFEQLADGPVLLATAFDSVDADCDNGTTLQRTLHPSSLPPGPFRLRWEGAREEAKAKWARQDRYDTDVVQL